MSRKLINRTYAVDDLRIDDAYQRLIVKRQVARIVAHYDEVAFGRILVGVRGDGGCWVVDGQQRLTAAREMKFKTVPCVVFDSEGRSDEAAMFVKYNADRAGMRPMDLFRAAVTAGDKESCAIMACAESCGFTIANTTVPDTIVCVGRLIETWRLAGGRGPLILREVLSIIKDVWPGNRDGVNSSVIGGLSSFLIWYGANNIKYGACDRIRLLDCLRRNAPMDLMRFAKSQARLSGSNTVTGGVRDAIVVIYNKGLKSRRLKFVVQGQKDEAVESG